MVVRVMAEVMSVFMGSWAVILEVEADHSVFEGLVTTVQMEAHIAYT